MKKIILNIKNIFSKTVFFFYELLIKPKSKDKNHKRREFILNILLTAALILSLISYLVTLFYYFTKSNYNGANQIVFFIISLIFIHLLFFSRRSYSKLVAYIFIILFFCLITYSSMIWGIDMPQALLSYALLIIMAGILISTKFSFLSTISIGISSFIINYLQINKIIYSNNNWRNELANNGDIIVYIGTLLIISVITWLYNRELEKSLDELEIEVEDRTKELKEAQLETMAGMYKSAEFGKIASGLMHDTINQLNALSLNLEMLENIEDLEKAKPFLSGSLNSVKKMMDYNQAVHKQLRQETKDNDFILNKEIYDAIEILKYKAKKNNIQINFNNKKEFKYFGNNLKFNQIITNLISNAIDAYKHAKNENKEITIKLKTLDEKYILTVKDEAAGIAKENLSKIFNPFFTTKEMHKGTGIGLANINNIIKKDFLGEITVKSKLQKGSVFTVIFPKIKK